MAPRKMSTVRDNNPHRYDDEALHTDGFIHGYTVRSAMTAPRPTGSSIQQDIDKGADKQDTVMNRAYSMVAQTRRPVTRWERNERVQNAMGQIPQR